MGTREQESALSKTFQLHDSFRAGIGRALEKLRKIDIEIDDMEFLQADHSAGGSPTR